MGVNVRRKEIAASCYNKDKTMRSLYYGWFSSYNWKLNVREAYLYKSESFLALYSELTFLVFAVLYIIYRWKSKQYNSLYYLYILFNCLIFIYIHLFLTRNIRITLQYFLSNYYVLNLNIVIVFPMRCYMSLLYTIRIKK